MIGSAKELLCRWHVGIAIHSSSQTQAVSGQQETTREGSWDWAESCMAVSCLHDESRLSLVSLCCSHMSRNLRHVSVNLNNIEGNIRRGSARSCACAGTKIVHIAAGAEHSMAVSAAGELFTWGNGSRGCLGKCPQPLR